MPMRGLEVTELSFDDLADEVDLASQMVAVRHSETRNRSGVTSTGSVAFPLTERIALDLSAHGEAWTRSYHSARGVPGWQLDVLVAGAVRVMKHGVTTTQQAEAAEAACNDARWMPLDMLKFANTEPMAYQGQGRAA
jgi:hypothetical protein